MNLKKDTIWSIKYFLKEQARYHAYGSWDSFVLSGLKVRSDGKFEFDIHWKWQVEGVNEDLEVSGDLNDYPIEAVLDGLDVAILIFEPIRKIAYDRITKGINTVFKHYKEKAIYVKRVWGLNDDAVFNINIK